MATAKGLAAGRDCPLVSIPTLDALAYPFSWSPLPVLPIIDAKKNRFYTAVYLRGERNSPFLDIGIEELEGRINSYDSVFCTGPHTDALTNVRFDAKIITDPLKHRGCALSLIWMGFRKYSEQGADHPAEGPLYLRKSDAELP